VNAPALNGEVGHSATVDRYLETIYYISAEGDVVRPGRLSTWLGVSAPTVSEALRRLERDGWIATASDRSVRLTVEGDRVARAIVRRHRVLERWLTDVLGFDWATADLEAERIAGVISDEVIERLDESMGNPSTCPHGNVIPGRTWVVDLVALSEVTVGHTVTIGRVAEAAEHESQRLLRLLSDYAIGVGASVTVQQRDAATGDVTVLTPAGPLDIDVNATKAIFVASERR
jgi:DtxR family Mn-dependent transcriptional regulator